MPPRRTLATRARENRPQRGLTVQIIWGCGRRTDPVDLLLSKLDKIHRFTFKLYVHFISNEVGTPVFLKRCRKIGRCAHAEIHGSRVGIKLLTTKRNRVKQITPPRQTRRQLEGMVHTIHVLCVGNAGGVHMICSAQEERPPGCAQVYRSNL